MKLELSLASSSIKVTAIVKNYTEQFYDGVAWSTDPKMKAGFDAWSDREKLEFVLKGNNPNIKPKIGRDSFSDKIDLNTKMRDTNVRIEYSRAPRKGYTLMTFIVG